MKKNDEKFYTPREIKKDEIPRDERSEHYEKAYQKVMENFSKIMTEVKDKEIEIEKHNEKIDRDVNEIIKKAAEKAEKNNEQFKWKQRQEFENERMFKYRDAYREAFYSTLQENIAAISFCIPDIDNISPSSIRPGYGVILYGTCFGPGQGKVLLQISQEYVVELEVRDWTETRIQAVLNYLISNTPLRSYYGKIWMQTGDGITSNVWPIMYYPVNTYYYASWQKHVFGGVFGKSKNGRLCDNKYLDSDFRIVVVDRRHWGDGWSEKRYPHASGNNLGQGWHIRSRCIWSRVYEYWISSCRTKRNITELYI